MMASDLRSPSSLRSSVRVRNGACSAQLEIDGMATVNSPAINNVSNSTDTAAAAETGRRMRSSVLATGVSISASTTAPAVGMRKSRAT